MSLKELTDALKAEHNIDIAKLQEASKAHDGLMAKLGEIGKILGLTIEKAEHVGALSDKIKAANEAVVELTEIRAAVTAKVQLAEGQKLKDVIAKQVDGQVALADRILLLEAEKDVDALLADEKILPAQPDHFIELRKTNKALYDKMTAGLKPKAAVDLSEKGADTSTDEGAKDAKKGTTKLSDDEANKAVDRYSKMASDQRGPGLAGVISKRRQPVTVGGKN
jgi:ribosomal protein S28E/S33